MDNKTLEYMSKRVDEARQLKSIIKATEEALSMVENATEVLVEVRYRESGGIERSRGLVGPNRLIHGCPEVSEVLRQVLAQRIADFEERMEAL